MREKRGWKYYGLPVISLLLLLMCDKEVIEV